MKRSGRQQGRKTRGAHIVEFASVLAVGLPLLILLMFVGYECAEFYIIKSAMERGAREAARGLVVNYNTTGNKKTVVDWLSTPNFIAGSNQFTVVWDSNTPPASVTVTCAYPTDGAGGLSPFPAGPLKYLGSAFEMKNISVQSTFTLPVQ